MHLTFDYGMMELLSLPLHFIRDVCPNVPAMYCDSTWIWALVVITYRLAPPKVSDTAFILIRERTSVIS